MDEVADVEHLVDSLIDREGGFVDNPADKGGPTCFGITEAWPGLMGTPDLCASFPAAKRR